MSKQTSSARSIASSQRSNAARRARSRNLVQPERARACATRSLLSLGARRRRPARRAGLVPSATSLSQLSELEALVELAQLRGIGAAASTSSVRRERQRAVGLDRQQLLALRQPGQRRAQILADDAADLARMRDHVVERAVFREPFRRGLRTDLGDARHVVHGVAGQRQQIEQSDRRARRTWPRRRLVELFVAHRVDQRHARRDQLREVLVAGGDQRVDAGRLALVCASVPITSSASTPSTISSGQP